MDKQAEIATPPSFKQSYFQIDDLNEKLLKVKDAMKCSEILSTELTNKSLILRVEDAVQLLGTCFGDWYWQIDALDIMLKVIERPISTESIISLINTFKYTLFKEKFKVEAVLMLMKELKLDLDKKKQNGLFSYFNLQKANHPFIAH
jgi:hypothetical protein